MSRPIGLRPCAIATVAALLVPSLAAAQALPPDPHAIFTLQDESTSITTASLTYRYYTNGWLLGYVSGTESVPDFLTRFSRAVWGEGQVRYAFGLTQQIYTPKLTEAVNPPPGDEPYAGVLLGNFALYRDVPDSRSTLALGLGVVGPAALGEQVQNGFHNLIGQARNNGWHTQLDNEALVEVNGGRTWRLATGSLGGLETDALPELAIGVGNLRIFAGAGAALRIGRGLNSDYGAPRLYPAPGGGPAFTPTRPFAWYFFIGANGQAVGRNITLDGNDFGNGPSVTRNPWIGELVGGIAVMAFGTRFTYTQVVQTQTFQNQKGGLHQMGSFALSVRF